MDVSHGWSTELHYHMSTSTVTASSSSSRDLPGKDAPWQHMGCVDYHRPSDPSSLGAPELPKEL